MTDKGLISLHGGHTWPACSHAFDDLAALVETAIARGIGCYAVTEHAPKSRPLDLDDDDLTHGFTADDTMAAFADLADRIVPEVFERYGDRISLIWGLETDVTPCDGFVERMRALIDRFKPEILVGSVHHVSDISIDSEPEAFARAVALHGDVEGVQLAYFGHQADLMEALEPDVVGHFDLIRQFAALVPSAPVTTAIRRNLERIADLGLFLEINSSSLRDGVGLPPFPAPDILAAARDLGVRVTLSDDSHACAQVAGGLPQCRDIARDVGFNEIWGFARDGGGQLANAPWARL